MRLSCLFSLASIITRAQVALTAPSLNAFTAPVASTVVTAGDVMLISWKNLSGKKATLQLAKGDPCDLVISVIIARDIENNGHAEWTVPAYVEPGKYSMMILPDDGSINYSAFFHIVPFDEMHGCPQKEREMQAKKMCHKKFKGNHCKSQPGNNDNQPERVDGNNSEGNTDQTSANDHDNQPENTPEPQEGNGQEQASATITTSTEGGPLVFTLCHEATKCVPKYYMSCGTKYVVHQNTAVATCCRKPTPTKCPQKNWIQKMLHC